MWIEFKNTLINLSSCLCVNIQSSNEIRVYGNDNEHWSEFYKKEEQTQARYEEIKEKLIGGQNNGI